MLASSLGVKDMLGTEATMIEFIHVPRLWENRFDLATRTKTLDVLLNELQQLPFCSTRRVRELQCLYRMVKHTDRARVPEIIAELESMVDSILAQGVALSIRMETTPFELRRDLVKASMERRLKLPAPGAFNTSYEGLGWFALSLASACISLGEWEQAREELAVAKRYFDGMDHQAGVLKVEFQEVRLSFITGNYQLCHKVALQVMAQAQDTNILLWEAASEYLFWCEAFLGVPNESVTKVFHQRNPELPAGQSNFLCGVLKLYQCTTVLVQDLHHLFPLSRTKPNQQHLTLLMNRVFNLVREEEDEMGSFWSNAAWGIARSYNGVNAGFKDLLRMDYPFLQHSPLLQLIRTACVVESLILQPLVDLEVDPGEQVQALLQAKKLEDGQKKFLAAVLRQLCPYSLYLLFEHTQDTVFEAAAAGILVIDSHKGYSFGNANSRIKGYPAEFMFHHGLDVMNASCVTPSQYQSSRKHCLIMENMNFDRMVFLQLLVEFKKVL